MTQAQDHDRWQCERAAAQAHTRVVERRLGDAIAVGDRGYARLSHRVEEYNAHLDAVRSGLRHAGYL